MFDNNVTIDSTYRNISIHKHKPIRQIHFTSDIDEYHIA